MKLWYGLPVVVSQVRNVLLCVDIPRHSIWFGCSPALLIDRPIVEQIRCQKSSGSISQWPGCGYSNWTSSWAAPFTCSALSKMIQRIVVVPTSKAATYFCCALGSLLSWLSILVEALQGNEWQVGWLIQGMISYKCWISGFCAVGGGTWMNRNRRVFNSTQWISSYFINYVNAHRFHAVRRRHCNQLQLSIILHTCSVVPEKRRLTELDWNGFYYPDYTASVR